LVRVGYQEKNRDGDGAGWGVWSGDNFDYEHEKRSFEIEVGGGMEKPLNKGTIGAAGIYYNYLDNKNGFVIEESWPEIDDSRDYPHHTEHQVIARFAGEHEISPLIALRMGLDFFYGWVREDFVFSSFTPLVAWTDDISLHGYRWGIGASIGGSMQFQRFTLEPFINAGYQDLNLDGDGEGVAGGVITDLWEMDKMRREWYVGGGLSVLFDLP
jgi:hypothetical protein